jgi:DNA primase
MARFIDRDTVSRILRSITIRPSRSVWWRGACPFCVAAEGKDTKHSMGLNTRNGVVHCFRCAYSGKIKRKDLELEDIYLADEEAEEQAIVTFPKPYEFEKLWTSDAWNSLSYVAAVNYVKSRKITRALAKEYDFHACDEGWWSGRIVIPVMLPNVDEWVGWVSRLWTKKAHPKAEGAKSLPYLYPKGMQKGRFLFKHHILLEESDEPALVMEGVLDAVHYPTGVAVFGKLSGEQFEALLCAKRPIVFVPDGDEHEAAWALAQRFRFEGKRAGYVKLPPRVDPDEVDKEWLVSDALKSLDRIL